MSDSTPRLYSAQPCDSSDPAPGVRLIRNGEVLNRLSVREAQALAFDLLNASLEPWTTHD